MEEVILKMLLALECQREVLAEMLLVLKQMRDTSDEGKPVSSNPT